MKETFIKILFKEFCNQDLTSVKNLSEYKDFENLKRDTPKEIIVNIERERNYKEIIKEVFVFKDRILCEKDFISVDIIESTDFFMGNAKENDENEYLGPKIKGLDVVLRIRFRLF